MDREEVEFYRDNGYVLVKGVFGEQEVERLRESVERLSRRATKSFSAWEGDYIPAEELKKLAIKGVHNIHYHDSSFLHAALHPTMGDTLTGIVGPNVQVHHLKMIVKPPQIGGGFPMHQDYPYFPHRMHTMVAASVHLDDTDEDNGCLVVVPGSHKLGPLPVANPKSLYLDTKRYPLSAGVACPAKAGDVLFFNYLTIHGSDKNKSDRTRRNFLIQYRDPEDLPAEGHENEHVNWGQGLMAFGECPIFRPKVQLGSWAQQQQA